MQLVLASTNPGKIQEMRELIGDLAVELRTPADFPHVSEPAEDGATFEQNALIKARHWVGATGLPVLADDSGLEVDALGGAPGVHSARYAPTAEERNAKLLAALKDVPREHRGARFVCVAALALPGGEPMTARGTCEGRIHTEPRGARGFGYDPVFWMDEFHCTLAELPLTVKNGVSHRGRALAQLRPALQALCGGNET